MTAGDEQEDEQRRPEKGQLDDGAAERIDHRRDLVHAGADQRGRALGEVDP